VDLKRIAEQLDLTTVRAFVGAARHVIDALLIEGERVRQAQAPAARDYASAELDRGAPGGGWISHEELRATAQRMSEAIAAERWVEGFVAAVRLLSMVRA
jgi:predicted phage gp36 major capsid-like protein